MLEKVKHENIVKLLAIEEEQEGRGKVGNFFYMFTHNLFQTETFYVTTSHVYTLLGGSVCRVCLSSKKKEARSLYHWYAIHVPAA